MPPLGDRSESQPGRWNSDLGDTPVPVDGEPRPAGPIGKNLNQRQLSQALGKSEGYVGHLESGKFRPTVETLKDLASVLGLLYGQIAGGGRLHHPGRV